MRRGLLACVLIVLAFGLAVTAAEPPSPPVDTPGSNAATVDLRTTLQKGLKARRPEEFEFINQVIALVDAKVLPITMVQSTFIWARRVPRTPMPYFERALRLRAKRIGVVI